MTIELSPADRRAVRDLITAATAVDGVLPLSEQGRLRLRDGAGPDDAAHHLVREGGTIVGYGVVEPGPSGELVVAPEARRRGHGRALLEEMSRAEGLKVWAHGRTPGAVVLARSTGMVVVRELYRMTRPATEPLPPVVVPDGVTIRAFRPGEDDEGFLAVNARAFAHHPEQGRFGPADLAAREAEPWFDAEGFFVAEHGGRILGFHWTKIDTPEVGEVYVVGVDPEEHGRGLGKVLTLAGLHHLVARGVKEIELYVDGDNSAARALYRRLGFSDADEDVMFARP